MMEAKAKSNSKIMPFPFILQVPSSRSPMTRTQLEIYFSQPFDTQLGLSYTEGIIQYAARSFYVRLVLSYLTLVVRTSVNSGSQVCRFRIKVRFLTRFSCDFVARIVPNFDRPQLCSLFLQRLKQLIKRNLSKEFVYLLIHSREV